MRPGAQHVTLLLSKMSKNCNFLLGYIVEVGNNLSIKSRKKTSLDARTASHGENSESHLLFRGGAASDRVRGWVGCGGVA